jgi:hypothetical protein
VLLFLKTLVETPQPTSNAIHLPIQKSNLLQKLVIDEVAGLAFLLLNI